jgi:hypothetical protein
VTASFPRHFAKRALTKLVFLLAFILGTQWVTAASVGPHSRKGDLLVGTFLQEELAIARTEKKDGERAVKKTLIDVGHEMAFIQ